MSWKVEVSEVVSTLPREFTLDDIRPFHSAFRRKFPSNRFVAEKVRQVLQELVAEGVIERQERGHYQRAGGEAHGQLPLSPGSMTSRQELAAMLEMDGEAGLKRGMFKPARGRFSRELLLFQQIDGIYSDQELSDGRFVYVGMGQPSKGDQKWNSFNKMLGEHLENGVRPHLFRQIEKGSPELEYVGVMLVEQVEEIFVEAEGRRVFQFTLSKAQNFSELQRAYSEIEDRLIERPNLEPRLEDRKYVISTTQRQVRDKAFGGILRQLYKYQCAVCGETHARGDRVDLQGAHVRPVTHRGPDEPNNGICLCARHHWAFDHGIFSLSDGHEILLYPGMGEDPHGEMKAGDQIALPDELEFSPHPEYLGYHRTLFRF